MKVILLAAGRGSRLGDLTKEKPKCMCQLAGKTLLERCLSTMERAGFQRKDIGIVTGYKKELFDIEGVTYFHNENWEKTNMVASLLKAREWLEKEPCIVCYSDIVFQEDAIVLLKECKDDLAITSYTGFWELWSKRLENPLEDLETFRMDAQQHLLEIGGKPTKREEIEGQYMGLLLITPQGFEAMKKTMQHPLKKTMEQLDMTTLLNALLEDGEQISVLPVNSLWLECDTETDIQVYDQFYKEILEEK